MYAEEHSCLCVFQLPYAALHEQQFEKIKLASQVVEVLAFTLSGWKTIV